MRILVNYQIADKPFLSMLAYLMKQRGLEAVGTVTTMSSGELVAKAKMASCSAILLCNEYTLHNITGNNKATLDSHRGSRFDLSVPTIVCNSLQHIKTVNHGEWLMGKDLEKFSTIHKPAQPFNFKVLKEVSDFAEAKAFLANCVLLSVDIETDLLNEVSKDVDPDTVQGGDTIITCCGWSGVTLSGQIRTFVLPLVSFRVDHWRSNADYAEAIQFMQQINALPIPKVMQNGMYDALHTMRYHAPVYNWVLDTLGMVHSEFSEAPKSLDFICSYYLYDYIQWKDEADKAKKEGDIQRYWAYNAKDCINTLRVAIEWLRHAPSYARMNYAQQFPLVYPFLYASFEGCLIDNEERLKLRAVEQAKVETQRKLLRIMFSDPNFNPGSWQQVEKYIYKVFGAKKPKIGKSKSCTDEKNLAAVGAQHPLLLRLTDAIIEYRGAQKAVGTYFEFRQLQGRLLYALDPFGTETARAACRSSNLWVGTQVQNIPVYAKSQLIADPGFILFEIDNKQSEARCTAYLSEEVALIAALESERDFYKTLGTLFFQIPYEDVTQFFRDKVLKKIVHGTNYMMGAGTFIENIGIQILYETADALGIRIVPTVRANHPEEKTLKQFAASILDVYHVPFPGVRKWYQSVFNRVSSSGRLVSPLGYTRWFFGKVKNHEVFRSAVAHEPQNLSVSIVNKGVMRVYKELVLPSSGEVRFKAQVHDSIWGQVLESKKDIYLPRIIECCNNPVVVHGRTLRIPTDLAYGHSWADKNKYKGV